MKFITSIILYGIAATMMRNHGLSMLETIAVGMLIVVGATI